MRLRVGRWRPSTSRRTIRPSPSTIETLTSSPLTIQNEMRALLHARVRRRREDAEDVRPHDERRRALELLRDDERAERREHEHAEGDAGEARHRSAAASTGTSATFGTSNAWKAARPRGSRGTARRGSSRRGRRRAPAARRRRDRPRSAASTRACCSASDSPPGKRKPTRRRRAPGGVALGLARRDLVEQEALPLAAASPRAGARRGAAPGRSARRRSPPSRARGRGRWTTASATGGSSAATRSASSRACSRPRVVERRVALALEAQRRRRCRRSRRGGRAGSSGRLLRAAAIGRGVGAQPEPQRLEREHVARARCCRG